MQINGTIVKVLPEVSGTSKSGKAWRKREYVVEYEHGQYPKSVVFSVMGDNIDKLNIQPGMEYDLNIDFEAREWNGRYFLQASCWRATALQPTATVPAAQPGWETLYSKQDAAAQMPADDKSDPLPF